MKRWSFLYLLIILFLWASSGYAIEKKAGCPDFSSFYCKSLYFTAAILGEKQINFIALMLL